MYQILIMKRIVLIFGIVLGVILIGNGFYMMNWLYNDPYKETSAVIGYSVQLAMLSLIFFGVLNFRNKELAGHISLLRAMKVGSLIALLGSTIYVAFWAIYYPIFIPDFIDQYTLHVLNAAERAGATASEIAKRREEMAQFKESYKNPIFMILLTYTEILPLGLIVAFISALILRKKDNEEK